MAMRLPGGFESEEFWEPSPLLSPSLLEVDVAELSEL